MKYTHLSKLLLKKILVHGILWLVVVLFYTFIFGLEGTTFKTVFLFSLWLLPVTLAISYTFIYYLIPKFLLQKKYFWFVLYSIYTLIISASYIIFSIFYGLIFILQGQLSSKFPISKSILFVMAAIYIVVVLACAFTLLKNYYISISANEELKNSLLENELQRKVQELEYLKLQIHPHFLFNTLNTLYALSLKKSEKTPEMILQLSNLLDYILYQTQKTKVFLKDEIAHIEEYIALEKNRFQEKLHLEIKIGEIPDRAEIPPMLLLPFIENSFKHGRNPQGEIWVKMQIELAENRLSFNIHNTSNKEMDTPIHSENKGLGLENIRKRLSILFEDDHSLNIIEENSWYVVELSINLKHQPAYAE